MSTATTETHITDLIDSLCYYDTQVSDPRLDARVKSLVEEEMLLLNKKDLTEYVQHIPSGKLEFKSTFLSSLLKRIEATETSTPILAIQHFSTLPLRVPTNTSNILELKQFIQVAQAHLEHARLALLNTNLLQRYGVHAWRIYSDTLIKLERHYHAAIKQTRETIERLNAQRKQEQMETGKKLSLLDEEWRQTSEANIVLDAEVLRLERQVQALRLEAIDRGLLPASNGSDNPDVVMASS